MPVSYYSTNEVFLSSTITCNFPLNTFPFNDDPIRWLLQDSYSPTWTVGARFTNVTVSLDIIVTKTIDILVLSTAYDAGTYPFYYEIIGSTTITDSGLVTVEIPVTFNSSDFLGIMIITAQDSYSNGDITVISLSANVSLTSPYFWTSYIGTTEETF